GRPPHPSRTSPHPGPQRTHPAPQPEVAAFSCLTILRLPVFLQASIARMRCSSGCSLPPQIGHCIGPPCVKATGSHSSACPAISAFPSISGPFLAPLTTPSHSISSLPFQSS
ncbi:hypothetical protein, partial [Schleiferia thermophila]